MYHYKLNFSLLIIDEKAFSIADDSYHHGSLHMCWPVWFVPEAHLLRDSGGGGGTNS